MQAENSVPAEARRSLRVVVCLDGLRVPAWVYEMLLAIRGLAGVELALLILSAPCPKQSGRRPFARLAAALRSLVRPQQSWAFALWSRCDRALFRAMPDAFQVVSAESIFTECSQLCLGPSGADPADRFSPADVQTVHGSQPDVILNLGSRPLPAAVAAIPRWGVWWLEHGGQPANGDGLPGAAEVLRGEPATFSALRISRAAAAQADACFSSIAPTDRRSIRRNRNNCHWKSAQFMPRKLQELAVAAPAAGSVPYTSSHLPADWPLHRTPGNIATLRGVTRIALAALGNRLLGLAAREQWFIAYRMKKRAEEPECSLDSFSPMVPPADRDWADPFPVRAEGKYFLFLEELRYAEGKGRIVVGEIAADGSWSEPRTALERPYHVSYPCVFPWNEQWYMVPETMGNRTIELWRCAEFPHRWQHECNLMEGVRAADATLAEIDGRLWMFACMAAEGAAAYDELFVFHAESPRGPWLPHRCNPVVSDARCARPAGRLFVENGRWMRPAQDCTGRYGRRMTLREIVQLTPDRYVEREVRAIEPDWAPGLLASHTLNTAGDLTVIDGCRRRYRWVSGNLASPTRT